MSDEFVKVATKEINEELESISRILNSCTSDEDITNNNLEIEKHLHKIKGLAPMIGQKGIGEIASLNDSLFKKIAENQKINGICEILNESNQLMKHLMKDSTLDISELKDRLKTKYSAFLE